MKPRNPLCPLVLRSHAGSIANFLTEARTWAKVAAISGPIFVTGAEKNKIDLIVSVHG